MLAPQCHVSLCLKPQSRAPVSFIGDSTITPGFITVPSLRPVKTHVGMCTLDRQQVGARGHPGSVGGRHRSVHTPKHVSLPPSLILDLQLHMLWEGEQLESCSVPGENYLSRLFPGGLKSIHVLGWTSTGARTAILLFYPPASHSTHNSLQR